MEQVYDLAHNFPDLNGKTHEELKDLLRAYQRAINVNIISSITDPQGTIVFANNKFCQVSKYSADELLGKNHRIINSGHHPAEFFTSMWQKISSGEAWNKEIKNKSKDGSFYWVDTVILPIKNNTGEIIQYLSLRTDITEKKLAEEERKEYTKKIREMLYMTSHRVRSPLATCLGLMNLIDTDNTLNEAELKGVIRHLKASAFVLDDFTKELTSFMQALEKKYNEKHLDLYP